MAQHICNNTMTNAFVCAQKEKAKKEIKEHPERFSICKLKGFCSDNGISVSGDLRFRKTFVDAIRKFFNKEVKMEDVKTSAVVLPIKTKKYTAQEELNYPANLVNSGEVGKYRLYINEGNEVQAEVIVTATGKRRVYITYAIGEFADLVKDDVNKHWYIPYIAIKKGYFAAPEWMERRQKHWIVAAMRAILKLHRIFEARVSRKRRHGSKQQEA